MLRRLGGQLAGVDQHGGAVGEDVEPGIAAPGADLVDVESSRLPGHYRLSDAIVGARCRNDGSQESEG